MLKVKEFCTRRYARNVYFNNWIEGTVPRPTSSQW